MSGPRGSDAPRLRGVVIDMDGLLVDSEPIYRRASQRAIARQSLELTDPHYDELIGLPAPAVHARLAARFGDALDLPRYRREFGESWFELVAEGAIVEKPGARQLLTSLEALRIPYVLATSTHRERMRETLKATGLDALIPEAVCGDEVHRGKPDPEIVHTAAARLRLDGHECVVIEDSIVGVEAALAATARALMVPDLAVPPADFPTRGVVVCEDLHRAREQVLALTGPR